MMAGIQLLYALVCTEAKPPSGMNYTYEGVTHALLVKSFPHKFEHSLVTCWLLDDRPHVERVALLVPKPDGTVWMPQSEMDLPARQAHGETFICVTTPEYMPVTFEQNGDAQVRVWLDGGLVYQCPLRVYLLR